MTSQTQSDKEQQLPLIVHIIYRLDFGGLENGLVNLINHTPPNRYRHAIVCLTESTDFAQRIQDKSVSVYALHKKPGKDLGVYWRLWRLLRRLRPKIVHTRNVGTIDCALVALLAGVPVRIHGEHGRDMIDLHGNARKYHLLRRIMGLIIHRFIALSKDLENWLKNSVGLGESDIVQVYNGVDTTRFRPAPKDSSPLWNDFADLNSFVIGTVGRMSPEKDQLTLVRAFIALCKAYPEKQEKLRLVLVGDGPLRAVACSEMTQAGLRDHLWAPGSRSDADQIIRHLDLFVLPSLIEGISNTILEAMASGKAVVATRVGGNPELVVEAGTGSLVPAQEPKAMCEAIAPYVLQPELAVSQGVQGRKRVEQKFSLDKMVENYLAIYDGCLNISVMQTGNKK